MLSKLYHGVALLSISLMLSTSGFLAYLSAAGKLTAERLDTIAGVLRGEVGPPAGESSSDGAQPPPATQPAQPDRLSGLPTRLRSALLERAEADVRARQSLLDQTMQHLLNLQETFEKRKAEWEARKKMLAAETRDAGFEKELEYVSKLPPALAKEHVVRTWAEHQADVVRLFMAMSERTGRRIMAEFKTEQELDLLHELLEQLRLQDVDHYAAESRRTTRDANP